MFLAPRRWHLWSIQQTILVLVLYGKSISRISSEHPPSRRTIGRWKVWLQLMHESYMDILKTRLPELRDYHGYATFWLECFKRTGLADAMFYVQQGGGSVP